MITYNRLELTKKALFSYVETATVPHFLVIADNGSTDGTEEWLLSEWDYSPSALLLLGENRYPGYACNRGWGMIDSYATFLHRADNDFRFMPGWCEAVAEIFENTRIGQVGLRTDEEEQFSTNNVGGNNIIRRELWQNGLRYDERPWTDRKAYPAGYSEDSYFSPAVKSLGWEWARVARPCIQSLASGDWRDPYYQESYGARGIVPRQDDPTAPGTT